ncbi:MAG: ribonuclease HI family protein [Patescibacteria group bacterium]|jgi:ribonuclease HI
MQIKIFSDGGARGNPGPAGIGVIIDAVEKKHEISKYIDEATNNQAEYQAVIEALSWVKENLETDNLEIECFLDSELIVEQLNQRYKLKNEGLKPLFWQVRDLVMNLGGRVTFKYISRERNQKADQLVNIAIDKALNKD